MRNLKRALSLTLASVMLLGMMVIGTSAASFTDADQITNETAATVLQELEVMQGSNGKFSPNQTVTRGQMAILICKMLYGSKLNAENFAGTSQFTDVPANAYYTGYVNLASQLGIISGYGNGKFGPGAPVTTAQAALMLTRALGWFQAGELENQSWTSNAIAAVEKATTVNLFGNMKLANDAPLSRDNVCEMVFNAMTKTAPVKYNTRWEMYYSDEGSIMQGVRFDYLDTLGYKNFKLVYDDSKSDDFGRPSTEWGITNKPVTTDTDGDGSIQSVTISTSILKAADEPDLSYTKDVKLCDIYKDLGKPDMSDASKTVTYLVNNSNTVDDSEGAAVSKTNFNSTYEGKVGAKGALTEVYKEADGKVKIVTIKTYLVKATADYSTKNEKLTVTPYGLDDSMTSVATGNKIENDNVTVSQFKKDDLILVTGVKNGTALEVKTATPATVVENVKVSAFKGTKDYVTAGGTKYSYNATATYTKDVSFDAYNLQKTGYNLILDKYDYVIGVEKYSDEVSLDDILFVKDAREVGWGYEAKVVFMDGSSKTVTVAATQAADGSDYEDVDDIIADSTAIADGELSKGRFYEFNEKSNGEYELKDIATARQGVVAASGSDSTKDLIGGELNPIRTKSDKTATNETIFIAKDTVYTGVKNSPSVSNKNVYYLLDNESGNHYILAVFTDKKGVATVDASEYVYVFSGNGDGKDDKDNKYYIYTAIKDGEKVDDFHANNDNKGIGLYKIESYENGYPVLGTPITSSEADVLDYVATATQAQITYKSGIINANGTSFRMASDGVVYVVDAKDKDVDVISASSVGSLETGNYTVYAIHVSSSNEDISALWLVKGAGVRAVYQSDANIETTDIDTVSATTSVEGVAVDLTGKTEANKMETVKAALAADATLGAAWTFTVERDGSIKAVAKTAGACGTTGPTALSEFTEATAGAEAVVAAKATITGTIAIGTTAISGGEHDGEYEATLGTNKAYVSGNDKYGDAFATLVTVPSGFTATTTPTNGGTGAFTLTADENGKIADANIPSVPGGSFTNGATAADAVAAIYTLAADDVDLAGKSLTKHGKTYQVTGADLRAQLESWAVKYNADAANTEWTASVNAAGNRIVFTAKNPGVVGSTPDAPADAPTGTSVVTAGVAAA